MNTLGQANQRICSVELSEPLQMKPLETLILLGLLGALAGTARGELQVVPVSEPVRVFAGVARTFPVVWRNTSDSAVTAEVRTRLLQTSSATTVTIGEWPWKKLQALRGQTITERATLDFPAVKAETRFVIQWLESTNRVLGSTEVLVYPTNLLAELKTLAGEDESALGIFDPQKQIGPLLKTLKLDFADLEETGVESFRGRLAIIGQFASRRQTPRDLGERVEKLARKGVGVVWIQPPPEARDPIKPSFYGVPFGSNAVVVAQAAMVSDLSERPQSQLNLIHFARQALNPEPIQLPRLHPEP